MYSIGILEDNESLRHSIEEYLLATNNYIISFSYPSYLRLMVEEPEIHPDFVLLDNHLGDLLGIDAIPEIKKKFPASYIIIITGDKAEDFLLKAIQNGACSYVYKPFKMVELESVLRNVEQTGSFLSPEMLTKLFYQMNRKTEPAEDPLREVLTKKEMEVVFPYCEPPPEKRLSKIRCAI
ncbi:MAG: DNA-binding response regulator [Chitinophagia bacterium]|nr:DNA-binding response regulator [Chitinophagia bacterium]